MQELVGVVERGIRQRCRGCDPSSFQTVWLSLYCVSLHFLSAVNLGSDTLDCVCFASIIILKSGIK